MGSKDLCILRFVWSQLKVCITGGGIVVEVLPTKIEFTTTNEVDKKSTGCSTVASF